MISNISTHNQPYSPDDMPADWYRHIKFILGAAQYEQLPTDQGAEVAFAGRSNVGKSSVINRLTEKRSLARVSKTPGRTREINIFQYNSHVRISDLPGYGYAKVGLKLRRHWVQLLDHYFKHRQSLVGVFLIMDIRHPMQPFDQLMLKFCQECHLPIHILLNKADKLSKQKANKAFFELQKLLIATNIVSVQLFSVLNKHGVDEARTTLAQWLFNDINKSHEHGK